MTTSTTYGPGTFIADIEIQFDDPTATDRHPSIDIPQWSRFAGTKQFGPTTRKATVEVTLDRPVGEDTIRDSLAVQLLRGQQVENLSVTNFAITARL